MLAHRNHPSIIQWSIGNEIEWTYPRNRMATGYFDNMSWSGNYFWSPPPYTPEQIKEAYDKLPAKEHTIEATAKKLAGWARELDTTRPVIANCILPSASFETGYADALDIVGFSYRRIMYDYAKENYPEKIVMGTESLPQWHEWKAIEERPFVSGTFLWTGIDYLGEANEQWPKKGIESGLLDLAGFKKTAFYMYKTLWTDDPVMHISTQTADKSQYVATENGNVVEKSPGAWEQALWEWYELNEHWNYISGENVIVEIISSCEEVELFLNDESLGKKQLSEFPDRIYKWAVPFEQGEIKAVGYKNRKEVIAQIRTAGEPTGIKLETDKNNLSMDDREVAHVVAQLIDSKGNPVKHIEKEINVNIDKALSNLGVDNGSIRSTQPYQNNKIKTHKGKALCIIRGVTPNTSAVVEVSGRELKSESVTINVK